MSNTSSNKFHLPNLKSLHYGGASCVVDPDQTKYVSVQIAQVANGCLDDIAVQDRFTSKYFDWLNNSTENNLQNLDQFPVAAYSNGTTESFDKFYLKNSQRRFRCFRGEYMYHGASWKTYFPNWCYIEEDSIQANDAVVMSMP